MMTITKGNMNTILSRCMQETMMRKYEQNHEKKNLDLDVTWREVNRRPDKD